MIKKKLLASFSVTFLTIFLLFLGGNIALFVDLQSASYVFLVGVIFFIASPTDRFAAFGNGCVNAGWLAFLVGLIYIFWGLNDVEVELIGPSFSVNFLGLLYGYFFKIVTLPFTSNEPDGDNLIEKSSSDFISSFVPFKPSGKINVNRPIKKKRM